MHTSPLSNGGHHRRDTPPSLSVRVHLKGATGLASADKNGKSDPYVLFSLSERKKKKPIKSKTKKKTCDPVWNQVRSGRTAPKNAGSFWLAEHRHGN